MDAYLEYATFIPVLLVLESAMDRSDWDEEDWEMYGEAITQIGSERALAGMRDTAMSDARRIYDFETRERALLHYAEVAPMHREACEMIRHSLMI